MKHFGNSNVTPHIFTFTALPSPRPFFTDAPLGVAPLEMRLSGHSAVCKHAVKRNIRPPLRRGIWLRTIHSTSSHRSSAPDSDGLFRYRDTPNPDAKNVAILGGGITGLSTAWNVSRLLPDASVTIFEKNDRLGGWIDSEEIAVDNGKILFEWGPRTLRPAMGSLATQATLDMLAALGLRDEILPISKASPAALNRYIYYPDHLVLMPSSSLSRLFGRISQFWKEPLFEGMLPALLKESLIGLRDSDVNDESVGDFLARRFGKNVTDNIASAFFHGIYAGDLYKLSARTLLPLLWYLESRGRDGAPGIIRQVLSLMMTSQQVLPASVVRFGLLKRDDKIASGALDTIKTMLKGASVYTFKHGLGEVISTLETTLSSNPKVAFRRSEPVEHVTSEKDTDQVLVTSQGVTSNFDYVVSSLSPAGMEGSLTATTKNQGKQLESRVSTACRRSGASVSVMVVNLYYRNPELIPSTATGFGYLIPRSVPLDQNPERVLGVLFSSESSGRPGSLVGDQRRGFNEGLESHKGQDTAPGTKLTVMMGGHWWDGWEADDLPSEEQAIEMAQSLLRRQLQISEAPEVAKARMNHNCIPQYPVGYREDMATIHEALLSEYRGRVKVAGPWWQGAVGVGDCISMAREVSLAIRHQWDDRTGLERYSTDEAWYLFNKATGDFSRDDVAE